MAYRRGFTLIELLLVIAIIGVLSAIITASLGAARSKGSDAGIKANLNTLGTQALIFLSDNPGGYGAFALATCPAAGVSGSTFFHNSVVERAIAAAVNDSYGGASLCYSTNSAWATVVTRPPDMWSDYSQYWCVDSSGTHCGVAAAGLGSPTAPKCGTCASAQ